MIVKHRAPIVVCCVSPADDLAVEMCRAWVKENGFTSETHRIARSETDVRVEEKIASERN